MISLLLEIGLSYCRPTLPPKRPATTPPALGLQSRFFPASWPVARHAVAGAPQAPESAPRRGSLGRPSGGGGGGGGGSTWPGSGGGTLDLQVRPGACLTCLPLPVGSLRLKTWQPLKLCRAAAAPPPPPTRPTHPHTPRNRICWQEGDGEPGGALLTPCRCAGSQKHVHERCLAEWMASVAQRKGVPQARRCDVCRALYQGCAGTFCIAGSGWVGRVPPSLPSSAISACRQPLRHIASHPLLPPRRRPTCPMLTAICSAAPPPSPLPGCRATCACERRRKPMCGGRRPRCCAPPWAPPSPTTLPGGWCSRCCSPCTARGAGGRLGWPFGAVCAG